MYYIGRFDGLPKTGVSGRQDLKITVLADFSTFWSKCPSMTIFKNENGMSPSNKLVHHLSKNPTLNFQLPNKK